MLTITNIENHPKIGPEAVPAQLVHSHDLQPMPNMSAATGGKAGGKAAGWSPLDGCPQQKQRVWWAEKVSKGKTSGKKHIHGNLRVPPNAHLPQEIAGLIKGLLTTIILYIRHHKALLRPYFLGGLHWGDNRPRFNVPIWYPKIKMWSMIQDFQTINRWLRVWGMWKIGMLDFS